jgi:hypothetical protein
LVLYILTEWKKPEARFKAYFDTMPKTYDEFPVMFDEKLMKMVEGTNLYKKAEQRKETFKKRYEFVKALDPEFDFTEKEFFAVCILVQSRVFGITVDEKRTTALVPVADMLNHNAPC